MLLNIRFLLSTVSVFYGLLALGLCSGFGGMSIGSFDLGSLLSSFSGGKSMSGGLVKTKAFIEESPEIGIGFQKVPIMLPLPTLILRKSKQLVSKGISLPLGCGGGGGCGGGYNGGSGYGGDGGGYGGAMAYGMDGGYGNGGGYGGGGY